MDNIEILDLNGSKYSISDANAIKDSEKGANGGVASLDNNGKIPISQIPSSVIDKDVVVAKTNNETTVSSSSTGNVKTYTVGIDSTLKSNISTSYTHSQTQGNPHNTNIGDINGLQTELTSIESDMDAIEAVIPDEATSSNKLADKAFVNSSITTNTATFRGTSAKNLTEAQFLAWANGLTKTKNDYCFWDTVDSDGNVVFKRYKYDGSNWIYEYSLNNSSFTSSQWASINSDIVEGDVSDLHTHLTDNTRHITAAERTTWNGKASQTALDNEIAARTNKDASQDTRIDGIEDDLDDHIADGVKHITSAERNSWNAKATSTDITNAINALDVSDTAVANKFVTQVSETNGKISVSRAQPTIANVSGLQMALDGKQATISDLSTIRTNATNGQTAYNWGNHSTAGYLKAADITGKEDKANRVSAWSTTPSDTKYPSEKLVKTTLDNKVDKVSGKGLSTNDYTTSDKNKLDGIAAGAEVNQNAFSKIIVGSTSIEADAKTDTLTLSAGTNITLTTDATNDKITISAIDTTYGVATTAANGLMSKDDKAKLDKIAPSAEVNMQSDWSVTDSTSDAFIKNKPTIPTKTSQLSNDSNFAYQNGEYTAITGMKVYSAVNSSSAETSNTLGIYHADDFVKTTAFNLYLNSEYSNFSGTSRNAIKLDGHPSNYYSTTADVENLGKGWRGTYDLVNDLYLPLTATDEQIAEALVTGAVMREWYKDQYVYVSAYHTSYDNDNFTEYKKFKFTTNYPDTMAFIAAENFIDHNSNNKVFVYPVTDPGFAGFIPFAETTGITGLRNTDITYDYDAKTLTFSNGTIVAGTFNGTATNANCVQDYGNTDLPIYIGYAGTGVTKVAPGAGSTSAGTQYLIAAFKDDSSITHYKDVNANVVTVNSALNATKATQDGSGNTITATYAKTSHTHNASAINAGTLPASRGGTGATSVANISAGKDSGGNVISATYLKKSNISQIQQMPADVTLVTATSGKAVGTAVSVAANGIIDITVEGQYNKSTTAAHTLVIGLCSGSNYGTAVLARTNDFPVGISGTVCFSKRFTWLNYSGAAKSLRFYLYAPTKAEKLSNLNINGLVINKG